MLTAKCFYIISVTPQCRKMSGFESYIHLISTILTEKFIALSRYDVSLNIVLYISINLLVYIEDRIIFIWRVQYCFPYWKEIKHTTLVIHTRWLKFFLFTLVYGVMMFLRFLYFFINIIIFWIFLINFDQI